MIFKITVLATALSTFTTLSAAGQLNTPTEFQAGTPALASEVNANFDAVESAVNDNDMRISSLEGRLIHNKTIVLQDGLAGYSGTIDTTLTEDESAWTNLRIPGDKSTAQQFGSTYDRILAKHVAIALLRFDVTGITGGLIQETETCADNIVVMDATLQLRGTVTNETIVYVSMMDPDAPLWVEDEATWDLSSAGNYWPTVSGTVTPVFNSALLGFSESREGWANSSIYQTLYFSIDTDYVKEWVCDDNKNKGLLIRQSAGTSKFISSEFPRMPPRPKLKLILQRVS